MHGTIDSRLFLILFLPLLLSVLPCSGPVRADDGGVEERILPNGLRVLMKEVHTSPIVSVWSWYDVGSRNERPGITGLAHLLEHMNFRGTEAFGREEMKSRIEAMGGDWNGYTWIDQTTYFETLPSDGLDLALRLEAERMRKSRLDPGEMERERTVVISEFRGGENDPRKRLDAEVTAAAFKAHPYGWPTIGWLSDLECATRKDLVSFYDTYYIPNNATLVMVGDFDPDDALGLVREYFGGIPVGPTPAGLRTREPEQFGERRVTLRRKGPAAYLRVAWHTPPVSHEAFIPLLLLDSVLAGGESINLWKLDENEPAARSSRLHRALVEPGLASTAGALMIPTKYPWLFTIYATAMEGVRPETLEAALLAEVDRLRREPVGEEELERAKRQLRARTVYDGDSVTEQAHQLGFFSVVYDYRFVDAFAGRLDDVDAGDLLAAARRYLTPDNRTVGWFLPTGGPSGESARGADAPSRPISTFREAPAGPEPVPGGLAPGGDDSPWTPPDFSRVVPVRAVLENGLRVLALRNASGPSVHIRAVVRAGAAAEPPGKSGVAALCVRYLLEGAGDRDGRALALALESRGTEIATDVQADYAMVDLDLLSEEMTGALGVLADLLIAPRFPEAALDRLRGELDTRVREAEADEASAAYEALMGLIYPPEHPYAHRAIGRKEDVERLGLGDVRAFHEAHYDPADVVIVVVGDLDPEEAIGKVERAFGAWQGGPGAGPYAMPAVQRQREPRRHVVTMDEKTQAVIAAGHLGIRRRDPEYAAIQVMNNVLGEFALGGRLGGKIREEKGLAYYTFSAYPGGAGPSPFFVMAGVSPESVGEALDTIRGELRRMAAEGPTDAEVERSKRNIIGSLALSLEENEGIAGRLAEMEIYGLGTSWLPEYARAVAGITPDDARRAAAAYIDPENLSLAVAGPIDENLKVSKREGEGSL